PALPYARAMLGARTLHEWAHLAVLAGWVPRSATENEFDALVAELADELDAAISSAPAEVRERTAGDLAAVTATPGQRPGAALARVLLTRLPDYQANLIAMRFMALPERETYVRQNIRTLRGEYGAAQLWRMLIRYLYEFQYLRFSAVGDRRTFFLSSTWFDR